MKIIPINILMTCPPGPGGEFVEVETDEGIGIKIGEWIERDDGLWALRIDDVPEATVRQIAEAEAAAEDFRELVDGHKTKIRNHVPWWHRIIPVTITIKRRVNHD